MSVNDQMCVIGFDSSARVEQDFTNDKEIIKNALRDTFTNGGTNICKAIQKGIDQFDNITNVDNKYMILLTDGSSSTAGIDSLLSSAKDKSIIIYTIGLGTGVNESLLKKIADNTGGQYYFADEADDLEFIFENIQNVGISSSGNRWLPRTELARMVDVAGFSYEKSQDIIVSKLDPHQKEYGFTYLYDEACTYLNMNIHCEPIYFFYDGKEYMIEFWKGQYGAESGAEIGVYYRDGEKPAKWIKGKWYKTNADDLMNMKFDLFKKKKDSTTRLLSRNGSHWWLTGFKWGSYVNSPSKLNMTATIYFKNEEMANAFINGHSNSDVDRKNYNSAKGKKAKLNNFDNSDDGKYGLKQRGYKSSVDYRQNKNVVTVYFKNTKCKQPLLMVKRRKTVRKKSAANTIAYRVLRAVCNDTATKKQYPNDPNNFDVGVCKQLNEKEVTAIVKNIYKEGTDVYSDFREYVSKYNKSLAKKLDNCVKYNKWDSLTERELEYLGKYIYKYYDKAYKMMEHAPSKALDAIMEKSGRYC